MLAKLEKRHGVDIGNSYLNKARAQEFTHYIAESQRLQLRRKLKDAKFYSAMIDGSTDAGNIDDELVMVQYCALDHDTQEVRSVSRFLSVEVPLTVNADGLIQCLQRSLEKLGVVDVYNAENVLAADAVLVGVSTDGAAVNISEINGMKGKMQSKLPWLMWQWCYGHRLELACKDALCSKVIKDVMELLLRLYYLYHKSPKKLRELEGIIADLREAYSFPIGGNVPVRCSGTRWIAHKRKALQ